MQLQNHKTDESKQAQSFYFKNYWGIYITVKAWLRYAILKYIFIWSSTFYKDVYHDQDSRSTVQLTSLENILKFDTLFDQNLLIKIKNYKISLLICFVAQLNLFS